MSKIYLYLFIYPYKLSMMLTIFSPLERVSPTIPHPLQGQYCFYHHSSIAGSFSIICNVQNTERDKYIHKIHIHIQIGTFFFNLNLQRKVSQLSSHELKSRKLVYTSSWSVTGEIVLS